MSEWGRPYTYGKPSDVHGTHPAGGERISVILIRCRNPGFRVMVITDEVVIIIDVP